MLLVPLQLKFDPIEVKRKIFIEYIADSIHKKGLQMVLFSYNTKKLNTCPIMTI